VSVVWCRGFSVVCCRGVSVVWCRGVSVVWCCSVSVAVVVVASSLSCFGCLWVAVVQSVVDGVAVSRSLSAGGVVWCRGRGVVVSLNCGVCWSLSWFGRSVGIKVCTLTKSVHNRARCVVNIEFRSPSRYIGSSYVRGSNNLIAVA
ncbi:hypothetical protein SPRG_19411, partial [Saprolegnia parasitica CBS 223.65]